MQASILTDEPKECPFLSDVIRGWNVILKPESRIFSDGIHNRGAYAFLFVYIS